MATFELVLPADVAVSRVEWPVLVPGWSILDLDPDPVPGYVFGFFFPRSTQVCLSETEPASGGPFGPVLRSAWVTDALLSVGLPPRPTGTVVWVTASANSKNHTVRYTYPAGGFQG